MIYFIYFNQEKYNSFKDIRDLIAQIVQGTINHLLVIDHQSNILKFIRLNRINLEEIRLDNSTITDVNDFFPDSDPFTDKQIYWIKTSSKTPPSSTINIDPIFYNDESMYGKFVSYKLEKIYTVKQLIQYLKVLHVCDTPKFLLFNSSTSELSSDSIFERNPDKESGLISNSNSNSISPIERGRNMKIEPRSVTELIKS